MKKLTLLLPFPALVISGIVIIASERSHSFAGWLCLASFFACLLTVPHHSKKSLTQGYFALIFPFIWTAAVVAFAPRYLVTKSEVQVIRSDPVVLKPIQPPETTRGK